ncbi:MAG: PqqD family protein [Candidatus Omnitrophica bacterium]|nr:PqqD family protein [Candidatus Omnitrophota bacterium]
MKKDLIEKKTKEGLFILTPDGESLFSLNDVGNFIWDALKHNKTRDEIVKDIVSFYDVEEKQARADLDIFINDIKKYSSELMVDYR